MVKEKKKKAETVPILLNSLGAGGTDGTAPELLRRSRVGDQVGRATLKMWRVVQPSTRSRA